MAHLGMRRVISGGEQELRRLASFLSSQHPISVAPACWISNITRVLGRRTKLPNFDPVVCKSAVFQEILKCVITVESKTELLFDPSSLSRLGLKAPHRRRIASTILY